MFLANANMLVNRRFPTIPSIADLEANDLTTLKPSGQWENYESMELPSTMCIVPKRAKV
jgi:hypothetical protein